MIEDDSVRDIRDRLIRIETSLEHINNHIMVDSTAMKSVEERLASLEGNRFSIKAMAATVITLSGVIVWAFVAYTEGLVESKLNTWMSGDRLVGLICFEQRKRGITPEDKRYFRLCE